MDTITSNSPEATIALGEQWAATSRPGWVIGLEGDLGTGKTHLVKGIAVIEWFNRWTGPRPADFRHVNLEQIGEYERLIRYEDIGA